MIVDVTRTIAPVITDISDRHRVRVETIIADFHDTLFAFKCATSERLLRLGVSMAQLNILYILRRSDEMPMSRLAEVLNVSLSNATGLIDRMEERGFIERTRVLADRRIVMVRLTPEGVRLLEEQDAMSEDLMRRVLDKLKPEPAHGRRPGDRRPSRRRRGDPRPAPGSPPGLHDHSTITADPARRGPRPTH